MLYHHPLKVSRCKISNMPTFHHQKPNLLLKITQTRLLKFFDILDIYIEIEWNFQEMECAYFAWQPNTKLRLDPPNLC